MKKLKRSVRLLPVLLSLLLALSPAALAAPAEQPDAAVQSSSLVLDGAETAYWTYALTGGNYPTLRAVAALLSGTEAQFDVAWDRETQSIRIATGVPYRALGGELTPPAGGPFAARPAATPVYVDGRESLPQGFEINGNHCYTLDTLQAILPFDLSWGQDERPMIGTSQGERLSALYAAAVDDARTVEPEELLPLRVPQPIAQGPHAGKILVSTWNGAPTQYPDGQTVQTTDTVWVIETAEFEDWYAGHADELADPDLRLAQLLGMPADAGCTAMTTLYVDPAALFRPAYNPDIGQSAMTTTLTGEDWFRDWFRQNESTTYDAAPGYPWTRLGYTYDWADNGTEYGFTEYIIRPGAQVEVFRTQDTADFLETMAGQTADRAA